MSMHSLFQIIATSARSIPGTSLMVVNGILCMPVQRFLQELHPDKGLTQQKAR